MHGLPEAHAFDRTQQRKPSPALDHVNRELEQHTQEHPSPFHRENGEFDLGKIVTVEGPNQAADGNSPGNEHDEPSRNSWACGFRLGGVHAGRRFQEFMITAVLFHPATAALHRMPEKLYAPGEATSRWVCGSSLQPQGCRVGTQIADMSSGRYFHGKICTVGDCVRTGLRSGFRAGGFAAIHAAGQATGGHFTVERIYEHSAG